MRPISIFHPSRYLALLLLTIFLALAAAPSLRAQWVPLNPVTSIEQQPDGALLTLQSGFLRFQICSESIVHITFSIERNVTQHPDYLITKKSWPKSSFELHTDDPKLITL